MQLPVQGTVESNRPLNHFMVHTAL